ncbi:winged helix-turn-helix transcriptional regulator [Catenulispora rubra]|uniref:winged helix-turn-helix transcriptional regulator n=1 Tax=Catenulispora rubra TaxID=280293 RepID=UPI001892423E|nr:helix-turn-helix domain-containing protein [Catenulispora rubra]
MSTRAATADPEERALDLAYDVLQARCPSRHALEHVTGRWGTLIMMALRDGPVRFNELRRRVDGVSEKMLSQGLQALERDGFVAREVQSTMPPKVEYRLTALGADTANLLKDLVTFLEARMPDVEAAQVRYDEAASA